MITYVLYWLRNLIEGMIELYLFLLPKFHESLICPNQKSLEMMLLKKNPPKSKPAWLQDEPPPPPPMTTSSRLPAKMSFWKRKSANITEYDPTYRVVYLGNVLTGWAKGESFLGYFRAFVIKSPPPIRRRHLNLTQYQITSNLRRWPWTKSRIFYDVIILSPYFYLWKKNWKSNKIMNCVEIFFWVVVLKIRPFFT